MNEEMDYGVVTFVDEETGDEINFQVLDYFFYNGVEYAVLTEETCDGCEHVDETGACEQHDCGMEILFALVETQGEEESFTPVDDDDLAQSLFEAYQAGEAAE